MMMHLCALGEVYVHEAGTPEGRVPIHKICSLSCGTQRALQPSSAVLSMLCLRVE